MVNDNPENSIDTVSRNIHTQRDAIGAIFHLQCGNHAGAVAILRAYRNINILDVLALTDANSLLELSLILRLDRKRIWKGTGVGGVGASSGRVSCSAPIFCPVKETSGPKKSEGII